ncbi:MAG: NAD(+) diphosphatase [Syntrophaceae bacterium]|nr:NAD(+) diphosphatase [Syntrophaceae bacterium]
MKPEPRFISAVTAPKERSGPAWWFAFEGNQLLIHQDSDSARVPFLRDFSELKVPYTETHYLGDLDGHSCYAVDLKEKADIPPGMALEGLRKVYGRMDEELFWLAARAVQIVEWDRTHRFCGSCGIPLIAKDAERSKECPRCGLLHFPRLAPAVIVLVERGEQLLMARSRHFAPGVYSVLAGFVEPGETLEQAVEREVFEEVGIRIRDIRYFGSQPWPFPHSLMIGFTARYAGGEIRIDKGELEDAGWFTVDRLPGQPGKISIARKLIEWFVAKQGHPPLKD